MNAYPFSVFKRTDAVPFADYLKEFWDFNRSPYVREKLRAEHSIHRRYTRQMTNAIEKYWLLFFPSELLGSLQPYDIERFVEYLSTVKARDDKPLSYIRKNGFWVCHCYKSSI